MTLYRNSHVFDLSGQLVGRDRAHAHGELFNRTFNVQAVTIDRLDVFRVHVAEDDVVSASRHVGTNRAANSSRSDDGELHSVPFVETLTSV